MIHPIILSIILLIIWREAENELARMPAEFPADVVTGDRFRASYIRLVSTCVMNATFVTAAVILMPTLDIVSPGTMQIMLFVAGVVMSLGLLTQSVQTAQEFSRMYSCGRNEGREAKDYLPTLVILPLLPAAVGTFY